MSSGSYFTIYKKHANDVIIPTEVIDDLKNEYFLSNKNGLFKEVEDEQALKDDIPLLMNANFKAKHEDKDEPSNNICYFDKDGIEHTRLLDFWFGSSFTCLKEHFALDPYHYSRCSVIIGKDEAKQMLQAIEYILSEDYSKKFEDVLSNEYVEIFGEGYSLFEKRFSSNNSTMYIDKDGNGYTVSFNDSQYDAEVAENDADIKFSLKRTRACLLAFLEAEVHEYDGEELVLEYTAY